MGYGGAKMIRRTLLMSTALMICASCLCAQNMPGSDDTPGGADDRVERELKTLAGQLADPARADKTKIEAAELLLLRSDPRATKLLLEFLAPPATAPNPRAQIAISEAIARVGAADKQFVQPLMALLEGKDEALRPSAARALATYRNRGTPDKLIAIAKDRKRDNSIRLAVIAAFRQVMEKKTIDLLVLLLDDADEDISDTAADTLAKLTGISAFRTNKKLAKQWWRENRNKKRGGWVAQLADSLARANASLEAENEKLRERLVRATLDLYAATPAAQRDAILAGLLADPLPDVRLVGAKLTERKIAANETVNEEIRTIVRKMLQDPDPRCRQASALLVANLGDKESLDVLLAGLKAEKVPAIRRALFSAIGQLRDAKALPAVLAGIGSEPESVVAAAAAALARIASKQPLEEKQRAEAANVLIRRYRDAADAADPAATREALLTAMGVLGQGKTVEILKGALDDPAATIRLAAVNALRQLAQKDLAAAVAELVDDPDRGVRQAVISALADLGGKKYLKTILARTGADETDDGMRQHAWDVVMAMLGEADIASLEEVLKDLADRTDAAAQRIKIMQMLVEALRKAKNPSLPLAQRKLGQALMAAGQPGEASTYLAEAYGALAKASSDQADDVWGEWIGAMLAANDPAVIKTLAQQKKLDAYADALDALLKHLKKLAEDKKFAPVVLLVGEAQKTLADRLSDARKKTLAEMLASARSGRLEADRKQVAELASQLHATDESARKAARTQLESMGGRAVAPLLETLQKAIGVEMPDPAAEKAILDVLAQIAPKLTGYDPATPKADRLKLIGEWLKPK